MAVRPTLLAAMLALALLAGCGDDSGSDGGLSDFEIKGAWKGELIQKGLDPFTVTSTIRNLDDPAANTVHYTGIDCGGNWTFLGRDGMAYRFREVIDRGAGEVCKGVGVVTLTPETEDTVAYEFRGGGIESWGILRRGG